MKKTEKEKRASESECKKKGRWTLYVMEWNKGGGKNIVERAWGKCRTALPVHKSRCASLLICARFVILLQFYISIIFVCVAAVAVCFFFFCFIFFWAADFCSFWGWSTKYIQHSSTNKHISHWNVLVNVLHVYDWSMHYQIFTALQSLEPVVYVHTLTLASIHS